MWCSSSSAALSQNRDLSFIFWSKLMLRSITAFKVSTCKLLKLKSKGAPSHLKFSFFKQTSAWVASLLNLRWINTSRGVCRHLKEQTGDTTCFSRRVCSSVSAHQPLLFTAHFSVGECYYFLVFTAQLILIVKCNFYTIWISDGRGCLLWSLNSLKSVSEEVLVLFPFVYLPVSTSPWFVDTLSEFKGKGRARTWMCTCSEFIHALQAGFILFRQIMACLIWQSLLYIKAAYVMNLKAMPPLVDRLSGTFNHFSGLSNTLLNT